MEILSQTSDAEKGPFFEKPGTSRPCWNCESDDIQMYNCASCTSIQQFLHDTDYFTIFNIGYVLTIDPDRLEKQYYELSRRFHPDYYQNREKTEQNISLENTAFLNKAFQTLKDPFERSAYLIRLIEGENKLPTEAPAELFEEIFEIQETLEALRDADPSDEETRVELKAVLKSAAENMLQFETDEKEKLYTLFTKWDRYEAERTGRDFTDDQKQLLAQMKQILSHTGYLDRILQDIKSAQ